MEAAVARFRPNESEKGGGAGSFARAEWQPSWPGREKNNTGQIKMEEK